METVQTKTLFILKLYDKITQAQDRPARAHNQLHSIDLVEKCMKFFKTEEIQENIF